MKKVNTFFALFVLLTFCTSTAIAQSISGKGGVVSETINMSKITAVGLGIAANVYIKPGSSQKIEIKGQKNIIDLLEKESRGGSWEIKFKRGYRVKSYEMLEVYITMSDIEALSIGGSGSIICEGNFKARKDLTLSIGGSGDIQLNTDAQEVECSIGGSGSIKLSGNAESLSVSIGGSGDVKASNLKVKECEISTAGSGDVEVHVSNRLNVSLVGSGDVRYKGNPKISKSIIGSGDVRSL